MWDNGKMEQNKPPAQSNGSAMKYSRDLGYSVINPKTIVFFSEENEIFGSRSLLGIFTILDSIRYSDSIMNTWSIRYIYGFILSNLSHELVLFNLHCLTSHLAKPRTHWMSSAFSSVVLNPAFRLAGDSNVGPVGMASPSSRLTKFVHINHPAAQ